MSAEFTQKLQTIFPDRHVEVVLDKTRISTVFSISVDGKTLRAQWNSNLTENLQLLHGVNAEDEIFAALVEEIKCELGDL